MRDLQRGYIHVTIANEKRWQKVLSIWLASSVLCGPVSLILPANAQQSLKGTVTKMGGLNTAVFETPHGKLKVNLPDDAAGGDTISGTVVAEPAGNTPEEKAQNEDELVGYVVAVTPKAGTGRPANQPSQVPTWAACHSQYPARLLGH